MSNPPLPLFPRVVQDVMCVMDAEGGISRIDNEDKLREKVDEALSVYNEYVGNAPPSQSQAAEGGDAKAEGGASEAQPDAVKA